MTSMYRCACRKEI